MENNLHRALGLIRGSLLIKDMEEFNKEGLINNLKEVEEILTKIVESEDGK